MKRWIIIAILIVIVVVIWFFRAPPRFWVNLTKKVETKPEVGARLVQKYRCRMCHQIGGEGALKAPSLDGITLKVEDPAKVPLRLWLRNPQAVKPNTSMPNFHLSDYEIEAIIQYLEALDRGEKVDISTQ